MIILTSAALALTVFTCADSTMQACTEKVTVFPTEQECADAARSVLLAAAIEQRPETIIAYCSSNVAEASKSTF